MFEAPFVAFVVLHQGRTSTRACVQSILDLSLGEWHRHVVLVDNGSGDGVARSVADTLPSEVTLIPQGSDLGFARRCNVGYHWAKENLHPDFVVVVTGDVTFGDDGFCDWVADEWDTRRFAVLGPDIIDEADGSHLSPTEVLLPTRDQLKAEISSMEERLSGFGARRAWDAARTALRSLIGAADEAPSRRSFDRPRHDVVPNTSCLVFSRRFIDARAHAFNPDTYRGCEGRILAYECMRDALPIWFSPRYAVRLCEQAQTSKRLRGPSSHQRDELRDLCASSRVLLRLMEEDERRVQHAGVLRFDEDLAHASHAGYAWAGNNVNVSGARRDALVSHYASGKRTQFLAWYGASGEVVIARREGSDEWSQFPTGIFLDPRDSHNTVSLAIDGAGVLHLFACTHNHPLLYARSIEPLSCKVGILEVDNVSSGVVSCPGAMRLPSGDLVFVRCEGVDDAHLLVTRYLVREGRWDDPVEIVHVPGGRISWKAGVDAAGRLHLVWGVSGGDRLTEHDVFYAVSTEATCRSFVTSEGRSLSLPIQADDADLVLRSAGTDPLAQVAICVSNSGLVGVLVLDGEAPAARWRLMSPHALGWMSRTIADADLVDAETHPFAPAQPLLIARDDTLVLVVRDDSRGGVADVIVSRHGEQLRHMPISLDMLGSWEPTCDMERWRRDGVLEMPLQYVLAAPDMRNVLHVETPLFVVSAAID